MTTPHPRPVRRRGALAVGAGGLLLAALLSTNGPTAFLSAAHGSSSHGDTDEANAATERLRMQLVDSMPVPHTAPPEAMQGGPEARLIAVYRLIAAHRLDAALQAAEALTRAYPNFKLAQLVRADLMSARFGALASFGTAERQAGSPRSDDLNLLRDEARLRLQALQERPPQGALPDEFVSLPPSTRFAIAVDTSRARLYLFENSGQGLKLVDDVYVSVGKQGVDKLVEGDQKTPLGVYFITDRLDPRSLQERFGAGALPLNYPNAYDKAKGRTGSGILLHGVPTSTYSRPPLDSDGCVAMANDDLQRLAARLPQRDTPVVITRKINWLPAGDNPNAELRAGFNKALTTWQQARLRADRAALQALYESNGPSDGAAEARFRQRVASPPASIGEVSVLTWHDDKDKMVVTFRELAAAAGQRDRVMRQYWSRSGKDWRIVAEGPVR